jgi:hypothetical protein
MRQNKSSCDGWYSSGDCLPSVKNPWNHKQSGNIFSISVQLVVCFRKSRQCHPSAHHIFFSFCTPSLLPTRPASIQCLFFAAATRMYKFKRNLGWVSHSKTVGVLLGGMEVVDAAFFLFWLQYAAKRCILIGHEAFLDVKMM